MLQDTIRRKDRKKGWTAKMYSSTTKDKQIRVNKGYREEQDNTVNRSQQKERENTNTNEDTSPLPQEKK